MLDFTTSILRRVCLASCLALTASTMAIAQQLDPQYQTNPNGPGPKKTISVDGDISDWNSSMLIAQGAANDDPRVYRDNSMYEVPVDLYALYGCYDDTHLYLMWEMTNVQDAVAPADNYPLTQGVLYQTMNVPFFIALNTGKADTRIGRQCQLQTQGTLWDTGLTFTQPVNKVIAISTNGANGPFIYGGDATGLNPKEEYTAQTAGITFRYGLGIRSTSVMGIDGAYGAAHGRLVSDMTRGGAYTDFNTAGHQSGTMDFHYEMAIPLDRLGLTADEVATHGLGVMLVATMGKSGMDCLPYDLAMNDNADQADTESQEFNSYEKSDADQLTSPFAWVGKAEAEPTPGGEPAVEPTTPPTPATGVTIASESEISVFLETAVNTTPKVWIWDANHDFVNYTGGTWPGEEMTLVGKAENGNSIYKWTYAGEMTAVPTHIIFTHDGETKYVSDDQPFTNHGYYTEGLFTREIAASTSGQHDTQPTTEPATEPTPTPATGVTIASESEISVFLETAVNTTPKVWIWDANHDYANYTGGTWPGEEMTLVGKAENGNSIYKWTYAGEMTAVPTHIIFTHDGETKYVSDDQPFTNHGYYTEGLFTREVTATTAPQVSTTIHQATHPAAMPEAWYTLGGRRIDQPTRQGIYIHGGRKVVVR